jgi:hypothetical protein
MTPTITLQTQEDTMTVDLPDDWVNYWDANPQLHGGLFTQFDSRGLRAIETRPPQTLPTDMTEHEHLVYVRYLDYDDEIEIIDGHSQAVNMLKDELESLNKTDNLLQAATDGQLPPALAWASTRFHAREDHWIPDEKYSSVLHDRFGVDKAVLPGYD